MQENMSLDSLVFELYAWGGRETVAELRWRLQRRGRRVEVTVAKQGLQSLGGGCKPGVAELWWGLYTRGCRVGVGVARKGSQSRGGGCKELVAQHFM